MQLRRWFTLTTAFAATVISSIASAQIIVQPAPGDPTSKPSAAAPVPAAEQPAGTPPVAEQPAATPPATPTEGSKANKPWRVARAVGSPDWLYFEAHHRTRIAHLINQFRADRPGDGTLLSFRTGIFGELRFNPVRVGVELLDSRAYLGNDVIGLNTSLINPLELLQAYAGLHFEDLVSKGDELTLRAGRITMDIGSRRLMARNRFRNTINAFTGLDARYQAENGLELRAFAVMPIQRRPTDAAALADNDIVFDKESFDVLHGGLFFASPSVGRFKLKFEGYVFGTYEQDSAERSTANRRLVTPGFRVYRAPAKGELDFELESAFQVGVSRGSRSDDDVEDLDHMALFQHAAVGYSPALIGHPRFVLRYDYASGDDARGDGRQGRFNALFGACPFGFGPTGIYGAFACSNIQSPGFRLEMKPNKQGSGFIGYRALWLDEAADGWTTSGLAAGPGNTATFIGHQLELRVRYQPFPGNLRFEPGIAHLFPANFIDGSEQANEASDSTMVYLQVAGKM